MIWFVQKRFSIVISCRYPNYARYAASWTSMYKNYLKVVKFGNFFILSFYIQVVDKLKVYLKQYLVFNTITIHFWYYYVGNLQPLWTSGDLRQCVCISSTMASAPKSSKNFDALEISTGRWTKALIESVLFCSCLQWNISGSLGSHYLL